MALLWVEQGGVTGTTSPRLQKADINHVVTCRRSWLPQWGVDLHFCVFSPPVSGHLLPQDQGQEGLPIAFVLLVFF